MGLVAAGLLVYLAGGVLAQTTLPITDFPTRIANEHSGLCWDVAGAVQVGTSVQQFPCHIGTNQRWTIHWMADGASIIMSSNLSLCVGFGNTKQLELQSCPLSQPRNNSQVWMVHRVDLTGRQLSKISSFHAQSDCIDVRDGKVVQTGLQVFGCHGGPNQKWLLLPLP